MRNRRSIIIVFVFTLAFSSTAQIGFTEDASILGVNVVCGNSQFGSGIAFFDYDNDGLDDITIGTAQGDSVRFFKNINGSYVEQTINVSQNDWRDKQINWVDIDNDGDNDLFITSDTNSSKLYENLGNMIMNDITGTSGILTDALSTHGASWGDYNNDGYLDVFISNYTYAVPNVLYKNNGDNTFTIVNNEAGIIANGMLSFCSAFFDYDNDGDQDLYVANDRIENTNTLYRNNGDGTFTDVSAVSGADITVEAMSVTIDDFDADGWLDIYVTNDIPGNVFLRNNGDGTFSDIAQTTNTLFNSVGWGAVFLDAENDGDLDLYVSGEHDGTVWGYLSSAFYKNNSDGTFDLFNSAIPGDFAISYANAIGDSDNDGYPEIVVNHRNHDNIFLWKNNTSQTNNWLKVKLEGTVSNRNGIGSFIEISINGIKQYRYTLCGEGYLSQNSATEIFGIGTSETVDYVKVSWLSGVEDIIYNVNANEQLNMIEGSTLSTEDYEETSIRIYPNPVIDFLNVYGQKDIDQISIFNILGEEVYNSQPNNVNTGVDMSLLNSGNYIVKVKIQNSYKTYGVLKM